MNKVANFICQLRDTIKEFFLKCPVKLYLQVKTATPSRSPNIFPTKNLYFALI